MVSILAVTYICTCEFEQPDKLKLAGSVCHDLSIHITIYDEYGHRSFFCYHAEGYLLAIATLSLHSTAIAFCFHAIFLSIVHHAGLLMSIALTAHILGHGVARVDISVVVTGLLDQFCRL